MEDIKSLAYYGSQIRKRRRLWKDKKAESPDTMCDVYAYSCQEAMQLAAASAYRGFSCRCIDKSREDQEKIEAKKVLLAALNRFGALPEGLKEMTFSAYRANPDWRRHEVESALHAKETCIAYAQNPIASPFLTIFGDVGAGKTHLAMAIAQETVLLPLWANSPDMLTYLKSTFDRDSTVSFHQEFERIRTAALLVIDDLSAERQSAFDVEQMYRIINHRHVHRLPTVITTNEDVLKMQGRIGSRMRDPHTGQVVRLDVQDNRLMLRRKNR